MPAMSFQSPCRLFPILFMCVLIASCEPDAQKRSLRNRARQLTQQLDNAYDTAYMDSLYCYSSTVINGKDRYTSPNFQTQPIALYSKNPLKPVVIIGKDRFTLLRSATDSLLWKYHKGKTTVKAFRHPTSAETDSVIIDSPVGQGHIIIRYAKK